MNFGVKCMCGPIVLEMGRGFYWHVVAKLTQMHHVFPFKLTSYVVYIFRKTETVYPKMNEIRNVYRQAYKAIFLRRPSVYGTVYVIGVFVFAAIYSTLPTQFYQSTGSYETGPEFIKQRLETSLLETFEFFVPSNECIRGLETYKKIGSSRYARCALEIQVKFAYVKADEVYFWLRSKARESGETFFSMPMQDSLVKLVKPTNGNTEVNRVEVVFVESYGVSYDTKIGLRPSGVTNFSSEVVASNVLNTMKSLGIPMDIIESYGISIDQVYRQDKVLRGEERPDPERLNRWVVVGCGDRNPCHLDISVEDQINLDLLRAGEPEGYLSPEGNLLRMFYFSVVTQTTLGYGDIVPISVLTRTIVAIQSLLGIIIIGLFLNALASFSSNTLQNRELT